MLLYKSSSYVNPWRRRRAVNTWILLRSYYNFFFLSLSSSFTNESTPIFSPFVKATIHSQIEENCSATIINFFFSFFFEVLLLRLSWWILPRAIEARFKISNKLSEFWTKVLFLSIYIYIFHSLALRLITASFLVCHGG